MAVSFQSPGINVNEYEIKNTILAPTSTSAAFAGVFKWGPADKIVKVISEADLVNTFGKPINDQVLFNSSAVSIAESFFSAANFLAYSSNLNIVRAAVVAATARSNTEISYNASTRGDTTQTANNNYSSCIQVLNEEQWITDFDGLNIKTTGNDNPYFIARYPGDLGNSLAVYVCSSSSGWSRSCYVRIVNTGSNKIVSNKSTSFAVEFLGSNNSTKAANTSLKGTTISPTPWNDFTVGDYVVIQPTAAKIPDLLCTIKDYKTGMSSNANTIILDPIDNVPPTYLDVANTHLVGVGTSVPATIYWQYKSNFKQAPTTSAYCRAAGTSNDELNILVVDKLGKITGIPGQVLEKYENVSKCVDAKTDTGLSNYYVQRIFEDSKYIYVGRHLQDNNSATPPENRAGAWGQVSAPGLDFNKTDNYPTDPGNYAATVTVAKQNFQCGSDGTFTTDLNDITYAFSLFSDKTKIDIDLIFSGSFGRAVKEYVCKIASDRKDCVAFISPDRATVIPSALAGDTHIVRSTDVTIEVTGTTDTKYSDSTYSNDNQGALNNLSSYCVMDSGWKFQYDKYNNNHKWMPLNADIAGLCAQTDNNYGSFWSPAGFSRGMIKNSLRLAWNPNQSDRDNLYSNGINPVCTFNEGTILYGDKTLSPYVSTFDRINVRRLFLTLEKTISKASKSSLFEFNDQFTRAQFIALVDPFLRGIKAQRGIYDYRIVCDESNNTANVIDQNQFIGDIYIKPSRSINFIQLNFVAVPTGVDFSTIVGNF